MLCIRCGGKATGDDSEPPRRARQLRETTCERCGATILTIDGMRVSGGHATLAQLSKFGLASGGKPLLQPRRHERE